MSPNIAFSFAQWLLILFYWNGLLQTKMHLFNICFSEMAFQVITVEPSEAYSLEYINEMIIWKLNR